MKPRFWLLQANALSLPLADESVHTVVTSPPYWGLRDYGMAGQLGLEATLGEYLAQMVAVFEEVRRVLRPEGVCWVNIGDSYASQGGPQVVQTKNPHRKGGSDTQNNGRSRSVSDGLKEKDLCLIPFRLAIALQEAGWWIRSDIIWQKVNPLPESVRDRPTKAHEYVFMLTKSATYYFDQVAVRETATWGRRIHTAIDVQSKYRDQKAPENPHSLYFKKTSGCDPSQGRNLRSVWTIPTEPYSGSHFATFPEALVRPCILAGPREVCAKCGAPWVRIIVAERRPNVSDNRGKCDGTYSRTVSGGVWNDFREKRELGWRPTCRCPRPDRLESASAIVLDPFAGSGTVGVVALRHGRNFIGCDLHAGYLTLAEARMRQSLAGRPIHRSVRPAVSQMTLLEEG